MKDKMSNRDSKNGKENGSTGAGKKIDEFIARKKKFVSAKEFEGKGKVFNFNLDKINYDFESKFGKCVQYILNEPNSTIERTWNASSIKANDTLKPLLDAGKTLLRIWTTGSGFAVEYHAEEVKQ